MQERLEAIADRMHEILMALYEPYDAFFKATEFWPVPLVLAVMVMPFALLHWLLPFKAAAIISFVVLIPPIYALGLVLLFSLDIILRPPRR